MNNYTLGLDIGSKSIGWALLKTDKKPAIIDIGVRVFPEGVDRDTKGLEKSKNATRREARGSRRIRHRRNLRRDRLLDILKSTKLFPQNETSLIELFKINPYELRARGLDEKLKLHEFGRALFHISQRRGFKSSRKTDKSKEEGKISKAVGELQARIEKEGCRTLGEYFNKIDPEEMRIRGHYTFRSMYEREFDLLWDNQAKFYPKVLTEDLRKKIRDEILFFQRPVSWDPDTIGDCELEMDDNGKPLKRCPRGDWYAIRFRLLQDVNNLKICNPGGSVEPLKPEQRKALLEELSKKKEVKFSTIRKKLGLLETQIFNAEYEINDKGKKNERLKGDIFNSSMRNKRAFGPKTWDAMDDVEKIKLNEWLIELEDEELAEKLKSEYGLNNEQIEYVKKISLPQRYMSFSLKAIIKLLPLMEQGFLTHEAIKNAGYEQKQISISESVNKLPLPPNLRNPIVQRALYEVRKVINAIVNEYGKPDKIKIEMARDVYGSRRQREKLHWKMRENEKINEYARKRLIEDIEINRPTREDVIKYKLWEECGKTCPYTGRHISQTALFGPNPEFQIEHILPYNRSLDDSFMNKTLCQVHENIHVKRDQTPYEAYSNNPEKFEELKQRVNRTAMPYWKKKKFWQKDINTDEIISRELNDTRYICREVVKYLKQICKNVSGTRGKVTSELAYQWGFVKDRNDHRHHAIDATVVAVTKNKHLRQLGESKYSKEGLVFVPPWPHFREELSNKVEHIDVSHEPVRKVSGKLHEETFYGLTKDTKDYFKKNNKDGGIRQVSKKAWLCRKKLNYVYSRTPAEILKKVKDFDKITDGAKNVKDAIKKRLIDSKIDVSDKKAKIPKEVFKETLYLRTNNKKRIPIKKIRVETSESNMIIFTDKKGNPYKACPTGGNHHVEIFENIDRKGKKRRTGRVITMFESVQRSQRGESVVCRDYNDGKKFVCSLTQNELFMLELDDNRTILHRIQKITQSGTNISIILRPHTYAGRVSDSDKQPIIQRKSPNTLKGQKVTVDMLGRIHLAND